MGTRFLLSILSTILLMGTIHAQTTWTTSATTTIPESMDASIGGKYGNPGAQIRFTKKGLDEIYTHALEMISRAIRAMVIADVIVPIGGGMLTVKGTRITEAKFNQFHRHLLPPNRIRSRLNGGKIVSVGQWQYKALNGARQLATGVFRTIVMDPDMNMTSQLGRRSDAKPSIQTNDCKAYLGRFRVEIDGFSENTTVIDHCENLLCMRIRSYFEDAVCNNARNYVKETINEKLATFPTRTILGPNGNRFILDYNLLVGEPKVTEQNIQAYLEGEVLSRGSAAAPFYANDMGTLDEREERMISFLLSDFAFNTLFHQAHVQQYRYSAMDLLPSTSPLKDLLKLTCTPTPSTRRLIGTRGYSTRQLGVLCMGNVFNVTVDQYPRDAMGDIVYKSQRPLQVMVRPVPEKSYFGVNGGTIEAYTPAGSDGKRELLARANVQLLRGEFLPKLNDCNITGSINITDLQLTQATPTLTPARHRLLLDPSLDKLSQLSTPIMTEMFNVFLNSFAQFPMPLVDGYVCETPELRWAARTMQIDSDVRVLADATRRIKSQG